MAKPFFLLSKVYVYAVDVRNVYTHSLTTNKIYTMSGTEKSNRYNFLTKPLTPHNNFPMMKEFLLKSF